MTFTKAQIVEELFAQNIFIETESARIIDTLFELIKQFLQNGEDFLISEFGKPSVKEKHLGCPTLHFAKTLWNDSGFLV
ncbi:MAG: HU family DNA-binding protein [Syntrophobacteraceae bacterium]